MRRWTWMVVGLAGCGTGTWEASVWGEAFIEEGFGEEVFDDGCEVAFHRFEVTVQEAALLTTSGASHGLAAPETLDLTAAGPHPLGQWEVPAGPVEGVRFTLGADGGPALWVQATLRCDDRSVELDWEVDGPASWLCPVQVERLGADELLATELTIHGDHLFYDGLTDPEAGIRGRPLLDADVDGDGRVQVQELSSVRVAGLGYSVGQHAEVVDLQGFVEHLVRSIGHVDGEGHCEALR